MPALPITVFADFTCAACYVTEAALRQVAESADISIRYRAAELDPASELSDAERDVAAGLRLPLSPPGSRPRTTKAHEAALLARALGAEAAMREAVYAAYWAKGHDIGRIDVLQQLAPDAGIDPFELKVALDIDRFRDDVLRDQEVARRLGIRTGPGARILIGVQTRAEIETAMINDEFGSV